jgi:hypothetical protein
METKRSRYHSLRWRLARERIGQLVRENYRVNQEMSPRLAAFIKKIKNENAELSAEAKDKTISEKAAPGVHPADCDQRGERLSAARDDYHRIAYE